MFILQLLNDVKLIDLLNDNQKYPKEELISKIKELNLDQEKEKIICDLLNAEIDSIEKQPGKILVTTSDGVNKVFDTNMFLLSDENGAKQYELGYRQFKRALERIISDDPADDQKANRDSSVVALAFSLGIDQIKNNKDILSQIGITSRESSVIFHSNLNDFKEFRKMHPEYYHINNQEELFRLLIKESNTIIGQLKEQLKSSYYVTLSKEILKPRLQA